MRLSEDEYFLKIAQVVAKRATCERHFVGALFVKDKRILSTGYNGAPSGLEHCIDVGCNRKYAKHGEHYELCRAVHAEQNAIIQASLHGVCVMGSTLYCTHQPCLQCAKMLINAKIVRAVYLKENDLDQTGDVNWLFAHAGVEVCRI